MSTQYSQFESGYLRPLPPLQLAEWLPVIAMLQRESRGWPPTALCTNDDGLQWETGDEIRARQVAMSLLKQREDGSTPCVYPFSGMQHHYFGAIAGVVQKTEEYNLSFAELGTAKRHVVRDLRYVVSINGGKGLKPYDMELFLRWYPVAKLDFHIPQQNVVVSVMAFLAHCFDDGSFGFFLNYAAFAYILESVKHGQAANIGGGCTTTLDPVSGVRIWHVHNDVSIQHCYVPDICLKCTMGVPRKVVVRPQNSTATYPAAWCYHARSWEWDKSLAKASAYDPRQPPDPLQDARFHQIAVQAGLQWTTLTSFKGALAASSKSKLYFAVVELGGHLGPGVQSIASLAAYNRAHPGQPLVDYYRHNRSGPDGKPKKSKDSRALDFTVKDPRLLALAMRKGKKYGNGTAKWALVYAAARCDHLLPEGWTTTPWRRHPSLVIHRYMSRNGVVFDGFDQNPFFAIDEITTNVSFVPAGARVVASGAELLEAQRAGLVPVVPALYPTAAREVMGFVHLHGGTSYMMRECIHCAMARVRVLRAAVDFVVIVCCDDREPMMQSFPQNLQFWK